MIKPIGQIWFLWRYFYLLWVSKRGRWADRWVMHNPRRVMGWTNWKDLAFDGFKGLSPSLVRQIW